MTTREMLEPAAKAAGIEGQWSEYWKGICYSVKGSLDMHVWRPQADDGDSKPLAVKLKIIVCWQEDGSVSAGQW